MLGQMMGMMMQMFNSGSGIQNGEQFAKLMAMNKSPMKVEKNKDKNINELAQTQKTYAVPVETTQFEPTPITTQNAETTLNGETIKTLSMS
jgi:hypothetical protein